MRGIILIKIYMLNDVLSKRIAPVLLNLQQRLRPSRRSAARAFAYGLRFRTEALAWQDEKRREWVLQRLRSVLREAAANTSYYSDLFRRIGFDPAADFGFDDFARLPALERQNIFNAGDGIISKAVPKALLRADASGGSSGEPVKIWVGPEEEGWHSAARDFFMRQIGVPRGARVAYLWGHHLDPVGKDSIKEKFLSIINNHRWFDCFRLSPDVLARYHQEMEAFQPDCIVAYASALAAFAQFLHERKLTPMYPRKCIVTGAEKLFDAQREVAEEVFRKPIYERYGSRDAGMMAFQLDIPQSKDFTVDWPNLLVEPETSSTESSILVTKLHADGMPMIRYRIGDMGSFPAGSRAGHPAFRLHSVVGRTAERIWLPNGSFIHGFQFPHLLKDFPVREFMVIQSEDFSVEVKIIPDPTFSEECKSLILKTISKNLPGIPITISLVDSILRTKANKWRPVLSHAVPRTQSEN
jgi:phenylacetate-CoA ligase